MSDAKDRRRINRVRRFIEPWADALGLSQSWSIVVGLHDDEDAEAGAGGGWAHWPTNYKKATISFDRKTVDAAQDDHLEQYAVHELVHLVIAPLDDVMKNQIGNTGALWTAYRDAREGITDSITRHLLNARDAKLLANEVMVYVRDKGEVAPKIEGRIVSR